MRAASCQQHNIPQGEEHIQRITSEFKESYHLSFDPAIVFFVNRRPILKGDYHFSICNLDTLMLQCKHKSDRQEG